MAIVKPARMHSAPGQGPGDLCSWAFRRFPDLERLGLERSGSEKRGRAEGGLLHRLDYETSGIVLFARTKAAFDSLMGQQARGGFRKEYLALSTPARDGPIGSSPPRGYPEGTSREAWALAREDLDSAGLAELLREAARGGGCSILSAFRPYGPKRARVACLEPSGGVAYRGDILGCSTIADGARLEIRLGLARGFRHQLRAQLSWIGLPISGDPLYGGAADGRLRLYAVALSFSHPDTGEPVSIEAPR